MCFSAMVAKITGEELVKTDYLDVKEIKMIDYPKNAKPLEDDRRFFP